jgi:hypothetical protein
MNKRVFFALTFLVLFLFQAAAQSGTSISESTDLGLPATRFDMEGFPRWSKDLRRAEIVAFGTFPFTMFIAITIMDSWRYATHGWDQRYAPWPIKGAGAIDMSAGEHKNVMLYAAMGSLVLAFADFVIVQIRRSSPKQKTQFLPAGTPIIIRTPLDAGGEEDAPLPGP